MQLAHSRPPPRAGLLHPTPFPLSYLSATSDRPPMSRSRTAAAPHPDQTQPTQLAACVFTFNLLPLSTRIKATATSPSPPLPCLPVVPLPPSLAQSLGGRGLWGDPRLNVNCLLLLPSPPSPSFPGFGLRIWRNRFDDLMLQPPLHEILKWIVKSQIKSHLMSEYW